MRFLPIFGLLLCLPAAATQAAPPPASTAASKDAMDVARQKVYPALVNIAVVFRQFEGGRAERAPAGGSGVIISPDGYVLTNFHVAGHTTHITCTLANGDAMDASVVTDDPLSDLSVLKLRRPPHAAPLPYAALGDSDKLQVGDTVLAMGNPLMLSSSMTKGIVSNTKRVFTDFTGTEMTSMALEQGEQSGTFTRWIQHDALILPGNSGGPLVNLQGEVVGINELGGNGVGFAIPSNLARTVFQDAIHYGKVQRGWLGFRVMPVSKLGRTEGALVSSVTPGSPAAHAGLQPGDMLLSMDSNPVNVRFFEEVPVLYQRIARIPAGHVVRMRLIRDGKPFQIAATVAPLEPTLLPEAEFRGVGVTVRPLTPEMALALHLSDTHGVLVTGVRPGQPFEGAQPPISEDDVIRSVDGISTPDIVGFRHALAETEKKGSKDGFPVMLLRNSENLLSIVKPAAGPTPDGGGELPRAWLGIKTQVLTPEVANAVALPGATGFRITEVYPFTEAARAGLKAGDVLTALNGSTLDASHPQDAEDLTHQVEAMSVGDKAQFTVKRGTQTLTLPVTLEATPDAAAQAKTARSKELEFGVRALTMMDRIRNHWDASQQGVLVTDVTSGGWASIAGLHPDDLLLSLNGQKITDEASFEKILPALVRSHPKVITVFVRRDVQTQFVFMEPDWSHLAAAE